MSESPNKDFDNLEMETTSDYTVINRGSPSVDEDDQAMGTPRSDILTRNSPRSGSFKCSQCFKVIEVGKPIYMRNDFPYCSKDCRELGVASIYRVLFGSAIDNDAGFVTRLLRQIGGSSTSVSSMDSGDEDEDCGTPRSRTDAVASRTVAHAARARARSFLNSVVSSVSQTSLGSSFIRTYSNSLLWGKDMTRNSSFNMLFAYLPEIKETEGPMPSGHSEVVPSASSFESKPLSPTSPHSPTSPQ